MGENMQIVNKSISNDNKTIKFLQKTKDNIITETAFIEQEHRFIICFSSQLGCKIGCKICYNGIYPNFHRNLTKEEMVKQCQNVVSALNLSDKNKSILFSCMGIGEPLLNYDNVINAIKDLNTLYPNSSFALATTGIKSDLIEKIAIDLKDLNCFKLTVSLHATNDVLRKEIIPINCSLGEIKKSVQKFKQLSNHRFEWNYVLLKEINDSKKDAFDLINFIDKSDKIKISTFNEITDCKYKKSNNLQEFVKILEENDIDYKIFNSSGTDIEIGCGQMLTHYNKKGD